MCLNNVGFMYEHASCCAKDGGFYDNGILVKPNNVRALEYYIKSAEMGNVFGLKNAGDILTRNNTCSHDDGQICPHEEEHIQANLQGITYLKKAIELNNLESMYLLAYCYFTGLTGVPINWNKCVQLLIKLIKSNYSDGLTILNSFINDKQYANDKDFLLLIEYELLNNYSDKNIKKFIKNIPNDANICPKQLKEKIREMYQTEIIISI